MAGCVASTPLHMAIEERNDTQALRLIDKSKNVDKPDGNGATALHAAARTGQPKAASALLQKGASHTVRNNAGATPLIEACRNGHAEVARLLVEAGADRNATDKVGNDCLLVAAHGGHMKMVKRALAEGTDINQANVNGRTALIMAAAGGHDGLARHLLKAGADLAADDDHGVTAFDIAVEQDNRGLARTLLQAGARPTTFSDTVPRAGWYTAESHFTAADYYEDRDRARALTYYRTAAEHYERAVDEWKDFGRETNGAIAGAVFGTMLIVAVSGAGSPTPSVAAPVRARMEIGEKRKEAEALLVLSREKVAALGG
ncbi:MAG: ankyrin repeat domain-containing protein [Pseudomonadota bacterium]